MKRYLFIAVALMVVLAAAIAYTSSQVRSEELRVFHAGSLTGLVEDIGSIMRERYSIVVLSEPSGSVEAIRKVVDLGKKADLIMVADHRLIEQLMMPKYTSWLLIFASNQMVLAYTNSSKFSNEINGQNWLDIISRPGVRVGASDPNKDPAGYRSLMVLALSYLQSGDERAMRLLEKVGKVEAGNTVLIDVSHGIPEDTGNLVFRAKSVDLIALLEAGVLDYAFEYRNVAIEHNLKFVELPKEVDLSDPRLDGLYGKVSVKILGAENKVLTLQASAITYGLTIPNTAENVDGARRFIELALSKDVLERNGFKFLEKPVVIGEAPGWLKKD